MSHSVRLSPPKYLSNQHSTTSTQNIHQSPIYTFQPLVTIYPQVVCKFSVSCTSICKLVLFLPFPSVHSRFHYCFGDNSLLLYENIDQIQPNKLHGPMYYKVGVTCVYNGHVFYPLL